MTASRWKRLLPILVIATILGLATGLLVPAQYKWILVDLTYGAAIVKAAIVGGAVIALVVLVGYKIFNRGGQKSP